MAVTNTPTYFDAEIIAIRKTCFQNKSKFIAEDYFVQHMNITTNKILIK